MARLKKALFPDTETVEYGSDDQLAELPVEPEGPELTVVAFDADGESYDAPAARAPISQDALQGMGVPPKKFVEGYPVGTTSLAIKLSNGTAKDQGVIDRLALGQVLELGLRGHVGSRKDQLDKKAHNRNVDETYVLTIDEWWEASEDSIRLSLPTDAVNDQALVDQVALLERVASAAFRQIAYKTAEALDEDLSPEAIAAAAIELYSTALREAQGRSDAGVMAKDRCIACGHLRSSVRDGVCLGSGTPDQVCGCTTFLPMGGASA